MRKWDYGEIAAMAKKSGDPKLDANKLTKRGFQKGILVMLPVCIGSRILTYMKGMQTVLFKEEYLEIVSKEEAEFAKNKLFPKMRQEEREVKATCSE